MAIDVQTTRWKTRMNDEMKKQIQAQGLAKGERQIKLYKVLKNGNSPFKSFAYEVGQSYHCDDFDPDSKKDCSRGFYATDIDGLPYAWRNLPGYVVAEAEVSGREVVYDQYKRRYEDIRIIRLLEPDEVRGMALLCEPDLGYTLSEVLFPVNPLLIERGPVTEQDVELLWEWDSVRSSVADSVWNSVWGSVRSSARSSVWDSVWDSVRSSARNSVWDSMAAYISSLFPRIEKWLYINHAPGINPFQPGIDLWRAGLVPSYDGKKWRLHGKSGIMWESRGAEAGGV